MFKIETDFLLGPFAGYDYGMGETSDNAYIIPIDENKTEMDCCLCERKKSQRV